MIKENSVKSKRFLIPMAIVLIAPAVIFVDFKTGLFADMQIGSLSHYAKLFANIGVMLFWAVLAFYVIKSFLLIMKQKSFTHRGLVLFRHLLTILRKIHPFAGACALVLLAVHGFIFAYYIYDFEVSITTVTGGLAFLMFFFAAMIGIALYRKPGNLIVRKFHRYAAYIVLVLVIAHLMLSE
jgi:hypothetical protein